MINAEQLGLIMPHLTDAKAAEFMLPLNDAMREFEINTTIRIAAFLAQLAHESQELTHFEENMNYSALRLTNVWHNRFPTLAAAKPYERNPEKLANNVYANRMGNGDEASGDGWRFHGRGPIQLTGREMYEKCGSVLALDLTAQPELLLIPENGFRSAGWFWTDEKRLNPFADVGDIVTITRKVNGGTTGLAERKAYYTHAMRVLA